MGSEKGARQNRGCEGLSHAPRPARGSWGIIDEKEQFSSSQWPEGQPMSRTVQAVYENGAFRPLEPVSCQEQERVVLTVENAAAAEENVLDQEFLAYCETQAD